MDMERITLSFDNPRRALDELRGLGRNLHRERFGALRGRRWLEDMLGLLLRSAPAGPSGVALEFELIYGHAVKAQPRLTVKDETRLSLDEMRQALQRSRAAQGGRT